MDFLAVLSVIAFYAILVVGVFALAFLPTIVAWRRKHPDLLWIFILNFGLGGTAIGWILALVWAFRDDWLLSKLKSV